MINPFTNRPVSEVIFVMLIHFIILKLGKVGWDYYPGISGNYSISHRSYSLRNKYMISHMYASEYIYKALSFKYKHKRFNMQLWYKVTFRQ